MAYGLVSDYSVRALRVGQHMDQSLSRGLEKFGEDILTIPEVIRAQTLNFKPNFKFSRSNVFGSTPIQILVCAIKAWSNFRGRPKVIHVLWPLLRGTSY